MSFVLSCKINRKRKSNNKAVKDFNQRGFLASYPVFTEGTRDPDSFGTPTIIKYENLTH